LILSGAAAALQGVMEGSIVKAACLAGQPNQLAMALKGMAAAKGATESSLPSSSAASEAAVASTLPPTTLVSQAVPIPAPVLEHPPPVLMSTAGPFIKEEPLDPPPLHPALFNTQSHPDGGRSHTCTSEIHGSSASLTHVQQQTLKLETEDGMCSAALNESHGAPDDNSRDVVQVSSHLVCFEHPMKDFLGWDRNSHVSDANMCEKTEDAQSKGLTQISTSSNKRMKIEPLI
jgi:hypothetical protein